MSVYSTVKKLVARVFVNPAKAGEDYPGSGRYAGPTWDRGS